MILTWYLLKSSHMQGLMTNPILAASFESESVWRSFQIATNANLSLSFRIASYFGYKYDYKLAYFLCIFLKMICLIKV